MCKYSFPRINHFLLKRTRQKRRWNHERTTFANTDTRQISKKRKEEKKRSFNFRTRTSVLWREKYAPVEVKSLGWYLTINLCIRFHNFQASTRISLFRKIVFQLLWNFPSLPLTNSVKTISSVMFVLCALWVFANLQIFHKYTNKSADYIWRIFKKRYGDLVSRTCSWKISNDRVAEADSAYAKRSQISRSRRNSNSTFR